MTTEMKTKTLPISTQLVSTNVAEIDASVRLLSTVVVAAGSIGGVLLGILLLIIMMMVIVLVVIGRARGKRKHSRRKWTLSIGNSAVNLNPDPIELVGMVSSTIMAVCIDS